MSDGVISEVQGEVECEPWRKLGGKICGITVHDEVLNFRDCTLHGTVMCGTYILLRFGEVMSKKAEARTRHNF